MYKNAENKSSNLLFPNHETNESSTIDVTVNSQDKCKLSKWGLPPAIYQKYEARGVSTMFPWQVECLANYNVLTENRNLVYSAPTSAGKTLVSEILIMKTVLERRKKAIFILPFVSVVREKMYYFQDLLSGSGIRVEGFMGNITPTGGFSSVHIAIATIEKANSLINRLIEEGELINLGIVVIDELHLLGDPNRGYLLELLLTKLKYASLKIEHVRIQLVGMSATLSNLPSLANWLNAELYKTDFRPIPLAEYCKIGDTIYNNKLELVRTLTTCSELSGDVENIFQICIETIESGHSLLIFCPTKNWCEKLALQIANTFAKLGYANSSLGRILREKLDSTAIKETLEQLKRCPIGLDSVLKNTVSFGVAFHHAGLTMDERDIIEGSFRAGSLKVLTATSTLSSGVNLPARRVLIRSPMFGGKLLDTLVYRQMIGRAGRMGKDTAGESILICKPNEKSAAETLLSAPLDAIESCLKGSGQLLRALLEAVASRVVRTFEDLNLYVKCTFAIFCDEDSLRESIDEATNFLVKNELLAIHKIKEEQEELANLEATSLGKACLAAAIAPKEGLFLFQELQKARKCFALDTELHILYLVTPYDSGGQIGHIDWINYMELWNSIGESERRVGQLVGVEERFLMEAMRGKVKYGKQLNIHKRFYTALALYDLINEVSLKNVCKKYSCGRGLLQSLQMSSATLAGMVTQFCKELGWSCMEILFSEFQGRLQFGVCRDLLDLLRLPSLNGLRARSLHKEGIKTVAELALANERDIERALNKAIPFESERLENENEQTETETTEKQQMKTIFVTGRDGLTVQRAALILIQEARTLIQNELGVQDVHWQNNENKSVYSMDTEVSSIGPYVPRITIENTTTNVCTSQSKCFGLSQKKKSSSCKEKELACPSIGNNETSEFFNNQNVDLMPPSLKFETLPSDFLHTLNEKDKSCNKINTKNDVKSETDGKQLEVFENEKIENVYHNTENKVATEENKVEDEVNILSFNSPLEKLQNLKSLKITPRNEQNTLLKRKSPKISEVSSPNLFEDSFMEGSVCSILEQNIFDSDFEKSNTSQFSGSKEMRKRAGDKKKKKLTQQTIPMDENNSKLAYGTWDDVPWSCLESTKTVTVNKIVQINIAENERVNNKLDTTNISKVNASQNIDKNIISGLSWNECSWDNESKKIKLDTDIKNQPEMQMRKYYMELKEKENKINANLQKKLRNSCDQTNIEISSQKTTRKPSIDISEFDDVVISSQNIRQSTRLSTLRKGDTAEKNKSSPKMEAEERNMRIRRMSNALKDLPSPNVLREEVPAKKSKENLKKTMKSGETGNEKNSVENDLKNKHLEAIQVVRIDESRSAFRLFKSEMEHRTEIALALACESYTINDNDVIGTKIISTGEKKRSRRSDTYVHEDKRLCGLAFSWGINAVYFMSLQQIPSAKVTVKERINLLTKVLCSSSLKIRCFATKEVYKTIYRCCNIAATCKFLDPKIADWLLNSDASGKSFKTIVLDVCPMGKNILRQCDMSYSHVTPGMNMKSPFDSYTRAVGEVILTWYTTEMLFRKLESKNPILLSTFQEVEMGIIPVLAQMELRGFGMNTFALRELSVIMQNEMSKMEEQAFSLAGRKFNFCSPKEVSQVLNLPRKGKISAGRTILEKCDNPIASMIIAWRKLNTTQTKVIHPLLRLIDGDSRIRGDCITQTVTGRISMHEPNIQNVPKDFHSQNKNMIFSVRSAFVPASGNIFLSADYCQLELRILAHFSKDPVLYSAICNKDKDVFKSISAVWNHVAEEEVNDEMRQRTKQLCYGMIYGMGTKTLAETLKVTESESTEFLEKFMSTFKGVRKWLVKVIDKAHSKGYVTTLLGRRRILSGLQSQNQLEKSQAERQAVNTKIQGTAADIVKKAMIMIDNKMRDKFPDSNIIFPNTRVQRNLRSRDSSEHFKGGYLVLHLHDELLYEVKDTDVKLIAEIVKESMEQAYQLDVPLPVKIKVGSTWGDLVEYKNI